MYIYSGVEKAGGKGGGNMPIYILKFFNSSIITAFKTATTEDHEADKKYTDDLSSVIER